VAPGRELELRERSMSVTVRVPSALRKLTGGEAELTGEGGSVREVLATIGARHPDFQARIFGEDGEVRQFLNVFVNGTDVRYEQGLDTPVKGGDELSIVPSIAGG
jgi:molybdopterin synthase sulfur carrier subunit